MFRKLTLSEALLPLLLFTAGAALLLWCDNNPWPASAVRDTTLFTSYARPVKSLDPSSAYYVHESTILDNIVEAPLEYDYLARPYRLVPRLVQALPAPRYLDAGGGELPAEVAAAEVMRAEYLFVLKPGILYQPHPCFARGADGLPEYGGRRVRGGWPDGYRRTGSRAVRAEDFKVALVRLCDPRIASPVYSTLSSFIAGMRECSEAVRAEVSRLDGLRLQAGETASALERRPSLPDYRRIPLAGFEAVDESTFRIVLSRKFPQAVYWFAMHFFAPLPWEALGFFEAESLRAEGVSFQNWPVGSGPYYLSRFDPANQIELTANPNYQRGSFAGQPLPRCRRIVFQLERESIPNWIKFSQGYYDNSGIPDDLFSTALTLNPGGDLALSAAMQAKGIGLSAAVNPEIFYFGFNMLDPVVGGMTAEGRALRQALSIILDYQEYLDIFYNGQGLAAQSVIPPGIFGYSGDAEGVNPWTDRWDAARQRPVRLGVERARSLLAAAGYPGGRNQQGERLTLYLDHASASRSTFKAEFQWLKSRFSLLGVDLQERESDLNRWRDKLASGNWQLIFNKGWSADYPDPENFLFLFCGDNGIVRTGGKGANYLNYASAEFDVLFRRLETLPDSPERLALIAAANRVLQEDAPCSWGFFPAKSILTHAWLLDYQRHQMSYSTMQYWGLDVEQRHRRQREWNAPPRAVLISAWGVLTLIVLPALSRRRKT